MPDWCSLARVAVDQWGTPIYIFHAAEIDRALAQLEAIPSPLPIRHWLSCKTLAVAPLLQQWNEMGGGIEVVSPFELNAALAEQFDPTRILVNGTAKHRWLPTFNVPHLHVQFDSLAEIRELAELASVRQWRVGIRVHTRQNRDPDDGRFLDHFGIAPFEVPLALDVLRKHDLVPDCVSFHLHSNLRSVVPYLEAMDEVASICARYGLSPSCLDIGGGLPAPGEVIGGLDGSTFDLGAMGQVFLRAHERFPSVRELWLENGRFISSRAGALVIQVWDVKQRGGMRYLICDGGRVNHALPSDWQSHTILISPQREGPEVATTICGPTCMAYDILGRTQLSMNIEAGDLLVWQNAGAYHLAWETRFSLGTVPVVWYSKTGAPKVVRTRESFHSWWSGS
jgi:diaminopimelate decarboxylase